MTNPASSLDFGAGAGQKRIAIRVSVNGTSVEALVSPRQSLADFLRNDLGLTATHLGCEHGVCGACTLRLDGRTVRSCLVYAVQLDGHRVETLEGLADDPLMCALQEAFVDANALQCGFCTPGILMTAHEYLSDAADHAGAKAADAPDTTAIRTHLSGNLCRCTGYQPIVEAISAVQSARNRTGAL